jgi:hypothetical protein
VTLSNQRLRTLLACTCVLGLVLVTAGWRLTLIQLGPDADSDSYGHHLAARHLFVDPSNQAAHWVWLPLFHWLQLPLLAAGGSIQWVRTLNVVLWALVPLALFALLARSRRGNTASHDIIAATGAALILTLSALGMQLGTTAQPEPLFTLLLVAFSWAQERRQRLVAALLLTAMVLLRYEAWAVLLGTALLVLSDTLRARRAGSWRSALGMDALVVVMPALAIVSWALVRAPFDGGRYFAFVTDTHDFARSATAAASGSGDTLRALVQYPLFVAARTLGAGIALVPFGVARLLREQRWLALSGVSVLAFITLGHATRATLGLERHFVAVLPMYAALMAFGALALAESLQRALAASPRLRFLCDAATRDLLQVALSGALLFGVYDRTLPWLRHWSDAIATRFAAEAAVARALDGAPDAARIYCDSPIIEGLVRFRGDRVQRGALADAEFRARILEAAQTGDVYVGAALEHVAQAALPGKITFRAERTPSREPSPWDAQGDLVVLHVVGGK